MLGHLGINVPDLVQAQAYYDEVLPLLGYQTFFNDETECAYMPVEGRRGAYLFFYPSAETGPYSHQATGLQHLAFVVRTRSAVRAVHRRALELGSQVLHEPREFEQYPPPYFATFWHDPFGFMLEAVCHHDRD